MSAPIIITSCTLAGAAAFAYRSRRNSLSPLQAPMEPSGSLASASPSSLSSSAAQSPGASDFLRMWGKRRRLDEVPEALESPSILSTDSKMNLEQRSTMSFTRPVPAPRRPSNGGASDSSSPEFWKGSFF